MNTESLLLEAARELEQQRVSAIKVSDCTAVCVEDLLIKLSLTEAVVIQVADYIETIQAAPDANIVAPDQWAVAGMFQAINEVRHALKCLCFGHAEAHQH
jgi:hypothetical protein